MPDSRAQSGNTSERQRAGNRGSSAPRTSTLAITSAEDEVSKGGKPAQPSYNERLLELQKKLSEGMGPAKFDQEFKRLQKEAGMMPLSPMHGGCAPTRACAHAARTRFILRVADLTRLASQCVPFTQVTVGVSWWIQHTPKQRMKHTRSQNCGADGA